MGSKAKVIAVLREPVFSPGMVEHDAAILRATVGELARRHQIDARVTTVAEVAALEHVPSVVLSMAEGDDSLAILEKLEKRGAIVVNSPSGVRATRREALLALSAPHGPLVAGALIETDGSQRIPAHLLAAGSAWIKRADYHALGPGDVTRVESGEVLPALRSMRARGIARAVVQPHLSGPVVKFYAVADGERRFFRAFPIEPGFQLGARDVQLLAERAFAAAATAGITVFGGDAVFEPGAAPILIDLNAWPSFWRCLADAAQAIADHAASRLAKVATTRVA